MSVLNPNRSIPINLRLGYPLIALVLVLALLPLATTPLTPALPARVQPGEVPAGLNAAGWAAIREAVAAGEYYLTYHEAETAYQAPNRGQGWAVAFTPAGARVSSLDAGWQWSLAPTAYGYAGDMIALAQPPGMHADRATLTYRWDDNLSEWWLNDPAGLEQGFTLRRRPGQAQDLRGQGQTLQGQGRALRGQGRALQGQGRALPLRIDMALRGSLSAVQRGDAIVFSDSRGTHVLTYDRLQVRDAAGATIPAHLELASGGGATQAVLRIVVDDHGARYPLTIDPWLQEAKLTASDGEPGDALALSVAMNGDTVVVGAPGDDIGPNAAQGSAYVFVKPAGGWATTSTFDAKLTASDGDLGDLFGWSVAVNGDTVVVGAFAVSIVAANQGAAYVFLKPAGGWVTTSAFDAKLTASDAGSLDYLGRSVAVSGDTVIVGADSDTIGANDRQGSAYVFLKPAGGWVSTSTFDAKLTASDGAAEDRFGNAVAISGDTLVVGALADNVGVNADQGSAYVFLKPAGGWATTNIFDAKLTASDGGLGDNFGASVAVSGDTVVVGALGANIGTNGDQGSAYIFLKPAGGWATTTENARLTASDGAAGDQFGNAVAINGDTVVVGAFKDDIGANADQGSAYGFVKPAGGWATTSTFDAKLTASDGAAGDQFGNAIAISGDALVVGAAYDMIGTNSTQGSAYIFSAPPQAILLDDFSATALPDQILVAWTTTSELNNTGFNLWRATSPDESPIRLNGALIPSQGPGSSQGFSYTWNDTANLFSGTTYYYWLEDVDASGVATRHGPISATYLVPTAVGLRAAAARSLPASAPVAVLVGLVLVVGGAGWYVKRKA